jgi:hypothetical protein
VLITRTSTLLTHLSVTTSLHFITLTMKFLDLQPVMQKLLDSGEYSDLTISCKGRNFEVHRAVVCSQSPVFDAALKHDFKVNAPLA